MKILLVDMYSELLYLCQVFWQDNKKHPDEIYSIRSLLNIVAHVHADKHFDDIIFCEDAPRDTLYRKKIAPEYKSMQYMAKSKHVVSSFLDQQIIASSPLQKLGFPVLQVDGYEAKDLIGSVVKNIENAQCFILSRDIAIQQLITTNTHLIQYLVVISKYYEMDVHDIYHKYGYHPNQVIDLLTMAGDRSVSIRGIHGFQLNRAREILQEYASIRSAVHSKTQRLPIQRLRQVVEDNNDLINQLQKIFTIDTTMDQAVLSEQISARSSSDAQNVIRQYNLFPSYSEFLSTFFPVIFKEACSLIRI